MSFSYRWVHTGWKWVILFGSKLWDFVSIIILRRCVLRKDNFIWDNRPQGNKRVTREVYRAALPDGFQSESRRCALTRSQYVGWAQKYKAALCPFTSSKSDGAWWWLCAVGVIEAMQTNNYPFEAEKQLRGQAEYILCLYTWYTQNRWLQFEYENVLFTHYGKYHSMQNSF